MKTKSFMNIHLVLITTLTAIYLIGCSSNNSSVPIFSNSCDTDILDGSASVCVTVDPATPTLDDTAAISITDTNLVSIYSWKLSWLDTGQVVQNCSGNQSVLNCQFERAGDIAISLSGQTRSGQKVNVLRQLRVIDSNTPKNQPPHIIAKVQFSGDLTGQNISTFETGKISTVLNLPDTLSGFGNYTMDFSQSIDDNDAASALQFEVNFKGAGFIKANGANGLSHTVNLPDGATGAHQVEVRATDSSKTSRILKFQIVVRCRNLTADQMTMPDTALDIIHSGEPNDFRYTLHTNQIAMPAAAPARGFQLAFDFNGDKIFDDYFGSPVLAGADYAKDQRNIFSGWRKVGVRVLDIGCGLQRDFEFLRQFNIVKATVSGQEDGAEIAVSGGQRAVMQAKIKQITSSPGHVPQFDEPYDRMTMNADVGVNKPEIDLVAHWIGGKPQRVQCGFQGTQLLVSGGYAYEKGGGAPATRHGMVIGVEGFSETYVGNIVNVNSSAAHITNARYYTDDSGDQFSQLTFVADRACSIKVKIEGERTPQGCCTPVAADGYCDQPIYVWSYKVQGAFGCESLKAHVRSLSNPSVFNDFYVSMGYESPTQNREGAFYCELQNPEASCFGDGSSGGGGGIRPR